jgi:hypothetical protein
MVEAFAVIWSLWLCIKGNFFMTNVSLLCRSSTGVPVCSIRVRLYNMGESKPIYEGIYTVEGHGKGYFYFTWMAA